MTPLSCAALQLGSRLRLGSHLLRPAAGGRTEHRHICAATQQQRQQPRRWRPGAPEAAAAPSPPAKGRHTVESSPSEGPHSNILAAYIAYKDALVAHAGWGEAEAMEEADAALRRHFHPHCPQPVPSPEPIQDLAVKLRSLGLTAADVRWFTLTSMAAYDPHSMTPEVQVAGIQSLQSKHSLPEQTAKLLAVLGWHLDLLPGSQQQAEGAPGLPCGIQSAAALLAELKGGGVEESALARVALTLAGLDHSVSAAGIARQRLRRGPPAEQAGRAIRALLPLHRGSYPAAVAACLADPQLLLLDPASIPEARRHAGLAAAAEGSEELTQAEPVLMLAKEIDAVQRERS